MFLICKNVFVISFLYVICGLNFIVCHKCIHSLLNETETLLNVQNISNLSKRSANENLLRIHVVYSSVFSSSELARTVKEKVIKPAVEFWESKLKVKEPQIGRMFLDRGCVSGLGYATNPNSDVRPCISGCTAMCVHMAIPETLLKECIIGDARGNQRTTQPRGAGVNADYILFVEFTYTSYCAQMQGTLGYATYCQSSANTKRPIAGYLNLCPQNYQGVTRDAEFLSVAKHEIGHALGFSAKQVPNFKFSSPPKVQPLQMTRIPWRTINGIEQLPVKMIVTPKLLKAAREYFKCDRIPGVFLENEGGEGTASSHFEQRIFGNTLMVGMVQSRIHLTRFELSFFEDSGWYTGVYPKDDLFTYAKAAGCDFYFRSCYSFIQNKDRFYPRLPYCKTKGASSCIASHNAYGLCQVENTFTTPGNKKAYLQPVNGRYTLGMASLVDDCPIYLPNSGKWSPDGRTSYCGDESNNLLKLPVYETYQQYGNDSRCIEHAESKAWQFKNSATSKVYDFHSTNGASCQKVKCMPKRLLIITKTKTYTCPLTGGPVNFTFTDSGGTMIGSYFCPRYEKYCQNGELIPMFNR